ncbi:MAG: nuclear transport factor 2 family protein [Pseudomonadota bacterium]|nr:nuclear transport factor 2 family protein [Pseudomonadota bacterium]
MILGVLGVLLALPLGSAAAPTEDYAEPYRILQQADRTLDPSLAASAYASDGRLTFDMPGQPTEAFRGTDAIHAAYMRTFGQVAPGTPIELEFRFEPPGLRPDAHSGAYRARLKAGGRDIAAYGRFSVKLVKQDGKWRFGEDRGTVTTAADFEMLPVVSLE